MASNKSPPACFKQRAKDIRDQRMTDAEKKGAALPPKLTVPMIVFFLPVLIAVIIGPAILSAFKLL